MRMIEQLAEAIRKIVGLRERGDFVAARDAAERGWDELLGISHDLVHVMDAQGIAKLLKEPVKLRVAAKLLDEEAHALAGGGDPIHAAIRVRMAIELLREAHVHDPQPDDDAEIFELSRRA